MVVPALRSSGWAPHISSTESSISVMPTCATTQPCGSLHWQRRRRPPPPRHQPAVAQLRSRLPACQAAGDRFVDNSNSWEDDVPILSDEEAFGSVDGRDASSSSSSSSSSDQPSSSSRQIAGSAGGSMQRDRWRVPLPPHLHGKAPRKHWNANALAFLGDSVWELYARRRFFYPPSAKDSYFGQVVQHVRAETQEKLYLQLLGGGFLTDTERDVLRWGRNATGVTPKRLADTGLKRETYRAATAIECLCGYLYLSDPERLHEMMTLLGLGDAPAPAQLAAAAAVEGAASSSASSSSMGSG